VIAIAFSFAVPALLLAAAALRATARAGRPVRAAAAAGAAALAAVPVGGLPLARWCAVVTGSTSVTLAALLAVHVWRSLFGSDLLGDAGRRVALRFAAVAGVALYPMALGLGSADPYALGWRLSPLTLALAALSLALVARGNRFGLVLALAALGHALGVLESPNLWDYVVDPALAVVSLVAVGRELAARVRRPAEGLIAWRGAAARPASRTS